jgi:hypothetical protein
LLRLSVRLCAVNLVFQAGGCQFFQWEDMMEQMSPILIVPWPPITIQVVPEVDVLRDRMDNGSRRLCVCIVVVVYLILMK